MSNASTSLVTRNHAATTGQADTSFKTSANFVGVGQRAKKLVLPQDFFDAVHQKSYFVNKIETAHDITIIQIKLSK